MIRLLAVLTLLFCASSVLAQIPKLDNNKPIEITADSLEVLQPQKLAIFRGKVVAKQGNVTLKSDKMTVHYAGGGGEDGENSISKIEVDDNVFLATPTESAKGSKGVYDVVKKHIRLTGDVILTRDKNVLRGSSLDYNLTSGKSVLSGGVSAESPGEAAPGGRVRGMFIPKKAE